MTEIIYKFNPVDDRNDLAMFRMGPDMWHTMWDYEQKLHGMVKHLDEDNPLFPGVRWSLDMFRSMMAHNSVNLDEVE